MYALIIGRSYPEKSTNMIGIFELEQAIALKKMGLKTIYGFCDNRSLKVHQKIKSFRLNKNGVNVYGKYLPIGGIPKRLFNKVKTIQFKKLIKQIIEVHGSPVVIHVHFPLHTLNDEILIYLKGLGSKIVITEHWSKVQTKQLTNQQLKFLNNIVEESDTYICVGEKLKQSVIELTNTSKNIKVIPNMLNKNFNYEESQKNTNIFRFISIGRLEPIKRLDLLIDAFHSTFKNNINVYLDIVGDGPLYTNLKKQINILGLTNRITLHGYVERQKTAELVKKSDVFVSASTMETFGVPFIEAMACGKPVIGVDTIPLQDFIVTNKFGELFKNDDQQSLSICMKYLYENYLFYNSQEISEKTHLLYSEENVISKVLNEY